jgi:hypothetical protein
MKHKFSGETCVYCGKASSESSDHVVARKFFLVEPGDGHQLLDKPRTLLPGLADLLSKTS